MSGSEDWRIQTDAATYLLHRQKKENFAARRPVVRRASDLVGPGISANSVRITDFNDLLATFNGYYSAASGASGAPNDGEPFIGYVISDAELGGRQVFTGLVSGDEYSRVFTRSPIDPETLGWSDWFVAPRIAPMVSSTPLPEAVPTGDWTALPAPLLSAMGDPTVYEQMTEGVMLRRQGIYTGAIRLVGSGTVEVLISQPSGVETIETDHGSQTLSERYVVPFTVRVHDEEQGFAVVVRQTSGSPVWFAWGIDCVRIGDAV